jgi:hypothetical protein
MKGMIDRFAAPSFHDGSGSAANALLLISGATKVIESSYMDWH